MAAAWQLLPQAPELIAVLCWLHVSQPADQGEQVLGGQLSILLPLQCSRCRGTPGSHPELKTSEDPTVIRWPGMSKSAPIGRRFCEACAIPAPVLAGSGHPGTVSAPCRSHRKADGRRYRRKQIGFDARAQELLRQGHTVLDSNGDGEACESLRR